MYFVFGVAPTDNELIILEEIHHFVEILDRFFGNVSHAPPAAVAALPPLPHRAARSLCPILPCQVCELDLIFNFHKAYYILDELFVNGELQETSKKSVLRVTAAQETLVSEGGDKDNQ